MFAFATYLSSTGHSTGSAVGGASEDTRCGRLSPGVNGKGAARPRTVPVGFLKLPQALRGGAGREPPGPGRRVVCG